MKSMTAAHSPRNSQGELEAHLPWLTLACANFAYTPSLFLFATINRSIDGSYSGLLLELGRAALLWLVSLCVMAPVALHHGSLRKAVRMAAEAGRAPVPGTARRRHFQSWRTASGVSLVCGPVVFWMMCCNCCGPHADMFECLEVAIVLALFLWLPASITWFQAVDRDARLLRKIKPR